MTQNSAIDRFIFALLTVIALASAGWSADNIDSLIDAGTSAYKHQDWGKAEESFAAARQLVVPINRKDERVGTILNGLALAQEAQGKREDALATYKEALVAKESE